MNYIDIHTHILHGVDDGPGSEPEMEKLLDALYDDGVRALCATPHFHPGLFGDHQKQQDAVYSRLCEMAARKYPDLRLYLGNEVRCAGEVVSWLRDGVCRTLHGGKHVLVDFSSLDAERTIVRGLERILNAGYSPVLAHVERYERLSAGAVRDLARNGVWLQADAGSFFGAYGPMAAYRARAMLKSRLLDLVASDAHDVKRRPPGMGRAYEWIADKCDPAYADILCRNNPCLILEGDGEEERDFQ